jgi:hypothetical protein
VASDGTAAAQTATAPPCVAACAAAACDRGCERGCGCGCCAGVYYGAHQPALESDAGHCFCCAHAEQRLRCCCKARHAAAPLLLSSHVCHAAETAFAPGGWWLHCEVPPRECHRPASSDCVVLMTLEVHTDAPLKRQSANCNTLTALATVLLSCDLRHAVHGASVSCGCSAASSMFRPVSCVSHRVESTAGVGSRVPLQGGHQRMRHICFQ